MSEERKPLAQSQAEVTAEMDDQADQQVGFEQLKKYAEDLRKLHDAHKAKQAELESVYKQLMQYAESLNTTVAELKQSYQELNDAYLDTIYRLALAAEYKDEATGDHIVRIGRYSSLLVERLGLPQKQVQQILYAAPMHDVGKIGIPEKILLKPAKLAKEEFEVIKQHTRIGANILSGSKSEILQLAESIALYHHERWDGSGYPEGLAGEAIPLPARIVAIVDTFDALTSQRPYKNPYPVDKALEIIRSGRGRSFDGRVTDVFLENISEILRIKREVKPDEYAGLPGWAWSDRDAGTSSEANGETADENVSRKTAALSK